MKLFERRILKKKEQIIASAIELINEKGYAGATMEDIAAELLMTKGSLYYYFKNKNDLLYQCHIFIFTQGIKDLEENLNEGGTAEQILRRMIETHIDYVIGCKETNNVLISPREFYAEDQIEKVLKYRKLYSDPFDRVIEKGLATGEFNVQDPAFVRMMILGSMNWTYQWYRPNSGLTLDEVKEKFGDYILKLLL
ncbi:TetR/AcrR family transcriptional regulator [Sporosarcina sp. CAU 1771]